MDNPGYQHDDPGAAMQQRPLPGTPGPGVPPQTTVSHRSIDEQHYQSSLQPLHQPLYLALQQQAHEARRTALVARRARSLRAPPRRHAPASAAAPMTAVGSGHVHDDHQALNNSRVSLASWSPGPSCPSSASHTPPLSPEDLVRNNPAVFLNNHHHALKHGAKLHPLRNALGAYPMGVFPLPLSGHLLPGAALYHSTPLKRNDVPGDSLSNLSPILQVCNNQLAPGEDSITMKKPCRCPPEEPIHEYSSIIGPHSHPHKASSLPASASTEPLYWSPILKRAAGAGGAGGGGAGNGPGSVRAPGDEGTLKKGWCGTSRVFKYIVQRRGRPRRGWRWLLWLLGAGALTLLMAVGLAAYLTSGFGLSRPTDNALRESDEVTLAGEFRVLNERWSSELRDTRSAAWATLSRRIEMQLDELFSSSSLSSVFRRSVVTYLERGISESNPDAVDVSCELVLSDGDSESVQLPDLVERAGLAFLRGLRHRAGRAWLGDLAVDVQSIGFVGTPVPEAAPTAAPTVGDPSAPGWSPWSAWSECYFTGSSDSIASPGGAGTMVRLRSRVCALDGGRGRPLDGPEPCLLRLPSSGSPFEMETCPDVQPAPGAPTAATILIQDTVVALGHANPSSTIDVLSTSSTTTQVPSLSVSTAAMAAESTVINSANATVRREDLKNTLSSSTEPSPSPFSMTTLLFQMDVTENSTTTSTTVATPRKERPRHCDECLVGEVCVALTEEPIPRCHPIKDPLDPTGCGGHCKLNFEFCHRLDVDAFRCMDDSACLPSEWRCGNQLCIPIVKRCDGHFNCYDHTDEQNCDCNLETHFQCGNRTSCLPRAKLCDRVVDCWDAADELNCTGTCPNADQFTCSNGECIPHTRFCDGFTDCSDRSDEPFGCGGDCKNHEWKCGNNRCIRKRAVCNGVDDCGDGSDERDCRKTRQPGSMSRS